MEAKQEEQARHMAELQSHADHLQQENDHLRTRLEGERAENVRGSGHPGPPAKQNKGKEPIGSEDSNVTTDDNYLPAAPHFRIRYPKRIMWRPSQERGPRDV